MSWTGGESTSWDCESEELVDSATLDLWMESALGEVEFNLAVAGEDRTMEDNSEE